MKEYIKKFNTAEAADGYSINDIPFITSIATDPVQNLCCNEEGKQLVNNGGVIGVETKGPEMVDLGLPSGTLWAANNIGAEPGSTKESYYGGYYAFGEVETKSNYSWSTYKFGASQPFSKYDTDGKTVLEAVDDMATQTYGSGYVMPTSDDIWELIDGTDNEWITNYNGISGLNGRKFMKKSDHAVFIFIPAAGCFYDSSVSDDGRYGGVWSSSLYSGDPNVAVYLRFLSDIVHTNYFDRYFGLSVRAIKRI